MSVLLRAVEVEGAVLDCRLDAGAIVDIGPTLVPSSSDEVVEGRGGALIAGLADHHLHLLATAARRGSVDVAHSLEALRRAPGQDWIRGVGAERELTREDLDVVEDRRPVRVQHAGGSLWTLNTAALERLGIQGPERLTGQLWRADARLRELLGDRDLPDVAAVGAELARLGVTHCTDATPDLDPAAVALLTGAVPQHLQLLGDAGAAGPRKIVVGDHELPDPDVLAQRFAAVHAAGRAIAVHVVTRAALVLTIAALRAAGRHPGDRVEHAAVCDDEQAAQLARLGVTVVTQPGLLLRHGDRYLRDVEELDRPWLWRCGGLRAAGVGVGLSSDAPYGPLDPWVTVRAARDRTTATGRTVGPAERIDAATALGLLQTPLGDPAGPVRRLAVGQPADVVLLAAPLGEVLADPDAGAVRRTFIGAEPPT